MNFRRKTGAFFLEAVGWLALLCLMGGCAGQHRATVAENITPVMAQRELPDEELLDVGIKVFDPGKLPEDEDERKGLSEEIRLAEADFIPVHLKYSMQRSGLWGSVWVLPVDTENADLMVNGKIDYSDGERLTLTVRAVDSRNVVWIDKTYSETCRPDEQKAVEPEKKDAFQDLYNAVSNDLAEYRNRLTPEEIRTIRRITRLRYAAFISPDPFSRYLKRDGDGHFTITALPARDDTMVRRIKAVRSRDEMLMDTLTGLYDNYYFQLWEPYQNWRRFRADELRTMHKIEHDAFVRQVAGFAAILGAVALGAISNQDVSRTIDPIRGIMAAGGTAAIYSGIQMRKETEMNKEVIEELGESFASESKPLLVEVNGETIRLTGTAKEQYATWQQILKKIYLSETGIDRGLPVILGVEQGPAAAPAPENSPGETADSSDPSEEKDAGNE